MESKVGLKTRSTKVAESLQIKDVKSIVCDVIKTNEQTELNGARWQLLRWKSFIKLLSVLIHKLGLSAISFCNNTMRGNFPQQNFSLEHKTFQLYPNGFRDVRVVQLVPKILEQGKWHLGQHFNWWIKYIYSMQLHVYQGFD